MKSIVIRRQDLLGIQGFQQFAENDNQERESLLADNFSALFASKEIPDHLVEEWKHFECISNSTFAAMFRLWNVLLRLSFSAACRRDFDRGAIPERRVYREALKYWRDYALFHYAAMPWVEAHYHLTNESSNPLASPLHETRVVKCLEFLEKKEKDSISSAYIGSMMDAHYRLLDGKTSDEIRGVRSEFTDAASLSSSRMMQFYMTGRSIFPVLMIPQGWPRMARILIFHSPRVLTYLLSRFNIVRGKTLRAGILPGILSEGITVDPMGFRTGERHVKSEEVPFTSVEQAASCNLLWHILSRLAVTRTLYELGTSEQDILLYFTLLRKFNCNWFPEADNATIAMSELDYDLVTKSVEEDIPSIISNSRDAIAGLEDLARRLFQAIRDLEIDSLRDLGSGLPQALNSTYMQI